ncbi:hypothetical protein [Moorena producens]|uniref:hypothetical protein n=1 Tax=Moorena producens TaxID=1155739 RepID=UPI0011EA61F9|nr:hypothetical protein [Moorena producens]
MGVGKNPILYYYIYSVSRTHEVQSYLTLIPCLNAGHHYSILPLTCSLLPAPCSLLPKNQKLCTSQVV